MTETEQLSLTEENAFNLSQVAIQLDQAREDSTQLATALERNMEVWVAMRIMVSRAGEALQQDTKDNLIRLSQFVAETTMKYGADIPGEVIDTLININLQISEGFLESAKA
ncbi:flagellar biosynthesis regulator FlaF [Magnetospira sp. QH-2]|uniref:flagellar biosynthesis regulator FlaF n=1 Tax=Magnetospira sp. (strain QH-2) TaxID=1288970 RepID=UPI0003E80F32|nr:flagellar biosynthesis regulator FlaF [Magnetospira sp. QH-2]CCQ74170.1 Putative flagellar biosynthesis regulatory protein FlaF [Magnetospira sp. QH-2]